MGRNKDNRLAPWAVYNEWIPLRCKKCGALFIGKNNVNSYDIRYGIDMHKGRKVSFEECERCIAAEHSIKHLRVDKGAYLHGSY